MDLVDSGLYRDITDHAHDAPAWLRHTAEIGTEAGLLVFVGLFALGWWRARHSDTRAFAIAVLTGEPPASVRPFEPFDHVPGDLGDRKAAPPATALTPARSSYGSPDFSRKPVAPPANARAT